MAQVSFPAVFTAGETCYIYGDDFDKKYGAVNNGQSVVIVNSGTVTDESSDSNSETIYQLAWLMDTGYTQNFWLLSSEIAASNGSLREATDEDLENYGVLEATEGTATCRVKRKGTKLLYGPDEMFYSAGRVNPSKALLVLASYPGYFFVRREVNPDDPNSTAISGFVKAEEVDMELNIDDIDLPSSPVVEETIEPEVIVKESESVVEETPTEDPVPKAPIPNVNVAKGTTVERPVLSSAANSSTLIPTNPYCDYEKCSIIAIPCDETRAASVEQKLAVYNAAFSGVQRFIKRGDAKGYSDIELYDYINLPTDYENTVYAVVNEEDAVKIKRKLLSQGFRPSVHAINS